MKHNLVISLFLAFLLLNSLTIFLIMPLFPAEAADHEITESLPNSSSELKTLIGESTSRTNPGEKNSGGQDCDQPNNQHNGGRLPDSNPGTQMGKEADNRCYKGVAHWYVNNWDEYLEGIVKIELQYDAMIHEVCTRAGDFSCH